MKPDDLIALNEEIAGMARAGLPLDQGLAALAREMGRGRLRSVTSAIANDLKAGRTLPEALERQGTNVPPYYSSLVAAGIRTGRIGDVLASLTAYGRAMANLRTIVLDALFYPAVILVFAFALLGFQLLFILPNFEMIFRDFQMQLPFVTELLLSIGRHPMELFFDPLIAMIVALLVFRWVLRSTVAGRRQWARIVYAIPLIGTLIRSARMASYTDLLAILVDNELPLTEAFRLAGAATTDPVMAASTRLIERDLVEGVTLADALRNRGLVPEWVAWMTGLGERRGTLGQTLHQIAETYRRQVEMRASLLRSVYPPFLILGTAGLFTAFFVFGVMFPLFKLLEALSK
jgi:type II secretory pathway component PulF